MMSHIKLVACKAPNECDPLKGNTFKIHLGEGVQGIAGATVTIANDLSYVIKTPGYPDQSGDLEPDGDNRYKYTEPGSPPITGRLTCIAGTWYFNDRIQGGGGETGTLELTTAPGQ